jgi:hypothetical protein
MSNEAFSRTTRVFVHPFLHTISVRNVMAALLCVPMVIARAQDNWPIPTVALYDCNSAAAVTDNPMQRSALASASTKILENIPIDTTGTQVFLITHGFADTAGAAMPSSGSTLTYSDTGKYSEYAIDYAIASTITGKSGAYVLTVSIVDIRTNVYAADGTASFSSATEAAVGAACRSAMQQILPLATKIRAYLSAVKAAHPGMTINPRIDVTPASANPPLNGKTDVVLTAIDCDGMPIANRQLALEASRGSFGAATAQTDLNGRAVAVFNAGKTPGIASLSATLLGSVSAVHDTTTPRGASSVIIGEADAKKLWVMDFDMSRSYSSCNDKLIAETEGTRWKQATGFWIQHARGRFIGTSNNDDNTEFSFNDSTLSLSGIYFSHDFDKETYTDITGKKCPQTDWSMGGQTWSYAAETNSDTHGEADVEYDPLGMHLFHIAVPFTNKDAYGYHWSTSGRWENGKCIEGSDHQGAHFKLFFNTTGGLTYYGAPPVKGLSIVPWYSAGAISGYTISVNGSYTGYASDGSFYIQMAQCRATITPLNTVTSVEKLEPLTQFFLAQNFPNPFNPATRIAFSTPSRSFVSLKIFDLMGREVAALVSEELAAGSYTRQWNAAAMSSGIYFYRLQAGAFTQTKKLVLMR